MADVFIRVFVQATAPEATDLAKRLSQRLDTFVCANVKFVRAYWKVREYQEIYMEAAVLGDPAEVLRGVTSRLGRGWMQAAEREAIWTPSAGASFVEPLVRWAHVEVASDV